MTAVGVIPARYHSTRFPGKVLAPIHGRPMVHRVYQRARRCRRLGRVLIATDSQEVFEACTVLGDRVVMTGDHHQSGTDRVAEAVRAIDDAEIVVNIQGDEPLLDPEAVDQLVAYMEARPEIPMGTLGSPLLTPEERQDPNVVKVVARDDRAVGFYRLPPAEPPDGELLRHVGLYAYRREFLFQFTSHPATVRERKQHLEQLRALDMGVPIGLVVRPYNIVAVDTPADLERVVALWHE